MQIRLFNRSVPVPGSRFARRLLGGALVVGGILGFLPILGFWMVPLGLIVLSIDSSVVRRWRRRTEIWVARRRTGKTEGGCARKNSVRRGS